MTVDLRGAVLALAFSLSVSAGITGASLSGESRENAVNNACADAAWPMIPARCLDGADGRTVRIVTTRSAANEMMASPFAIAVN